MSEVQTYDQDYHDDQTLKLAHHIVKIQRALGALPKTNDRPWNTYFRRPLNGLIGTNFEVYRVPQGRYLLIDRIVLGPVAHAVTGASGFMIDYEQNQFDPMYAAAVLLPTVTFASENGYSKAIFVNEGETLRYFGSGTTGDILAGVLYGRLIIKDIHEGLDITLPDSDEETPYPTWGAHTSDG